MTKQSLRTLLLPAALASGLLALSTMSTFAADKVIKIGGLLPLSGPGSYFGAQDKQGAELALEHLNKFGVNGFKFSHRVGESATNGLGRFCQTQFQHTWYNESALAFHERFGIAQMMKTNLNV
jgi:hypothetical protein